MEIGYRCTYKEVTVLFDLVILLQIEFVTGMCVVVVVITVAVAMIVMVSVFILSESISICGVFIMESSNQVLE